MLFQLNHRLSHLRAGCKRGWSSIAFTGCGIALLGVGAAGVMFGNANPKGSSGKVIADVTGALPVMPVASTKEAASEAAKMTAIKDFLATLRTEALTKKVPAGVFDAAFANFTPDPEIIGFTTRQPEHDRAPWDYVNALVSKKRIADGKAMLAAHGEILNKIETAYGVDRHLLVAIWGIETSYGSGQGGRNVLRSLATLAYEDARRAGFWKDQLIAALQIVANGDISSDNMGGSWAGAMGHTQFMPTTYLVHAVDFDRDGRRDIWNSIPDALASAANYLKASDWTTGDPWGTEVTLPANFDYALTAPGNDKSVMEWLMLGVGAPQGSTLPPSSTKMRLFLPAGASGPAFLVGGNFKAILRYNNSTLYALSAGHLADILAGGGPIRGAWPVSDIPLARAEREELQAILTKRGLDTGGIDGILGSKSKAAIRTFQAKVGLPADGYPNGDLLQRLRRDAGAGAKKSTLAQE